MESTLEKREISEHLTHFAVRGSLISVSTQLTKVVLQFGSTALLARLLSPSDFGVVAMVMVLVGIVLCFKDFGLSTASVQRRVLTHGEASNLFWLNAGIGILLALLLAAAAPAIAGFYHEQRLLTISIAISCVFLFEGLSAQPMAMLRRELRFGLVAKIELGAALCGSILGVVWAICSADYWALIVAQVANSGLACMLLWAFSGWRPSLYRRNISMAPFLRFGANMSVASLLNQVGSDLDKILLGRSLGAQPLAFYSRAYQILLLPLNQINGPLALVAIPSLSRVQSDWQRYERLYVKALEKILLASWPICILVVSCSDWIIRLALGPGWEMSARILALIGAAAFILPAWNAASWLLVTQGRTRELLIWHVFDTGVKVASIIIGLRWGLLGLSVAVSVRYFLEVPALIWLVCRSGPVKVKGFLRAGQLPLVMVLFMGVAAFSFRFLVPLGSAFLGLVLAAAVVAASGLAGLLISKAGRLVVLESWRLLGLALSSPASAAGSARNKRPSIPALS